MAGRAKAVSEEYKSALVDLTFNSKPMINLLTMLAEENNEYAQCIVNVICERIKQVVNEQKMPALYLLDSILKNIGKEYMSIISKNIVEVFCCVFETAPDERKRMQLFKLRNTWNQYIPNKTLYELDVRITRTDPNWPVAAPVVSTAPVTISGKQVIHVNPKFLKTSDPSTATTISATLAASIVAEKEASKLQNKINKQRLLEEEKRVQEQLRILQADKLKRDREQHELVLRRQQLERERLIVEQKRQLELLRKQQQSMTEAATTGAKSKSTESIVDATPTVSKSSEVKPKDPKISVSKTDAKTSVTKPVEVSKVEHTDTTNTQAKSRNTEISSEKVVPTTTTTTTTTTPSPAVHGSVKDPRLKNDMLPNDPRVNRLKSKSNKSAVNVMNKIVTNLSTKKTQPEDIPQKHPSRKVRPYVNPLYARSPVCIATASQSFASSSYSTLNLSISSKENVPRTLSSPVSLQASLKTTVVTVQPNISDNSKQEIPKSKVTEYNNIIPSSKASCVLAQTSTNTTFVTGDPNRKYNLQQVLPVCTVTQSHSSSIMQSSVSSCVTISNPPHSDVNIIPSVTSRIISKNLPGVQSEPEKRKKKSVVKDTGSSSTAQSVSGSTRATPVSDDSKVKASTATSKSIVNKCSVESKTKPIMHVAKSTDVPIVTPSSDVKLKPLVSKKKEGKTSNQSVSLLPEPPTLSKTTAVPPTTVSQSAQKSSVQTTLVPTTSPVAIKISKTPETIPTSESGDSTTSSAVVPPPFSGAFKKLSSRDMQIAAQAAAIATAMHQMQSGSTGMAPEQSAQLAAQLIEIMQGAAKVTSTSAPSTTITISTTSTSTADTSTAVTDSRQDDNLQNKKKAPKENLKVKEINQIINRERSARSGAPVSKSSEKGENKGKTENSTKGDARTLEKVRERSPHDSKRETRLSRQRSEGREGEKLKSPERSLRSRTRERDKTQVILGEEPPAKRSKDSSDPLERGRKARARSPSRYYNRMERKIESEKRVEEKEKELVLERIRKVSDGDSNEPSKTEKEAVSTGKERKSPLTVTEKTEEEKDLEMHHKEFNSLKDKLYDIHKKKEQTGSIDQDMLTKIMAEVGHKSKDGVLLKDHTDELMWEIRHIRAEFKHMNQKPTTAPPIVKMDYIQPDANEHLHWRSRKDLANDLGDAPSERGGPRRPPFETFNRPVRPDFQIRSMNRFPPPFEDHSHGAGRHNRFEGPMSGHMNDGPPRMRGPPSHYVGDGPAHFRDRPPHMQDRPHNMHDAPPGTFMGDATSHGQTQLIDGTRPPYNADGQHAPHNVDGQYPPHGQRHPRMDGPRHPHMDGQLHQNMMDGSRPPHLMDGPRPPHMMDGSRPPHLMDAPRPPHLMDAPRPPHLMDGPQPPHMMDGPRPPHLMDGPRPPHMMDRPRPPHMMDGSQPPQMMDRSRPPHFHDGQHPHMENMSRPGAVDGPRPPSLLDGPRPLHRMEAPPMQHMDGSHMSHRVDVAGSSRVDSPRLPNMVDGMRPPQQMDGTRPTHLEGTNPPYMMEGYTRDGLHGRPQMDGSRAMDIPQSQFMMEGQRAPQLEGSTPQMMNSLQSQQMDVSHSYPDASQSLHSHMQHWGQGHTGLHQGHSFHNAHVSSQSWTSNLGDPTYRNAMSNLTSTVGASSTIKSTIDVSSLLGQLTAAGLLPKSDDKKVFIPEPDEATQPKQVVIPDIRLMLEDLRVRREVVVDSLFKGMQCSSCGERFPSESLNQYRDHLDWHFRQNRREKDGVRKGCRAWYFNLNEWVDQTTLKVPEAAKVQSSSPETEEVKEEEMDDMASHAEEPQKLVEDNSIPVGETAGDVCNVCMDPLEQYWDEDREEWRYRKAVRENKKTYHYHCFVDYVPFELEEDESCTPPETPSFPRSPTPVEMDQIDDSDIKKEEMEHVSTELDISTELNNTMTELNTSTEFNTSTVSELNTSAFPLSRLTVSMMEVLKSEEKVTDIPSPSTLINIPKTDEISIDNYSPVNKKSDSDIKKEEILDNRETVGFKSENVEVGFKTETDVMNTIQDILRVASSNLNIKMEDTKKDTKTVVVETLPKHTDSDVEDIQLQREVENVISEIIDTVTNTVTQDEVYSETVYLLPGANLSSIKDDEEDVHIKTESNINDIETELITSEIGSWEMHSQNRHSREVQTPEVICSNSVEESIGNECDKKELDEEADAYSPYIENVDSPVYPVITTSNLTCIDEDSSYSEHEMNGDFPLDGEAVDSTVNNDVTETVDYLISKVTLNSEAVSINTQNLFTDGLSVVKMEPCVRAVGSDLNKSVDEVINNISVDG